MSLFDTVSEHQLTLETLEAKGYVYSEETGFFQKKVSAYGNIAVKFLPDRKAYQVNVDFYSWMIGKWIWAHISVVNTESEFFDAEIAAVNKIKKDVTGALEKTIESLPFARNILTGYAGIQGQLNH